MQIQDVSLLYDYNYWANGRILGAAARVSLEQLVAPARFSFASLRATLVHTLDTEYGWRMLCQHGTLTLDMDEAEFPTFAVLEQRWHDEETTMRAYLAALQDEDMTNVVRYTIPNGEQRERVLWHCLVHVVNHGTQHRSEAAAMLTEYGQSPGDLDFTLFLSQRR
jgi:uncharacterized damage-inducible protein DinB